MSRTDNSVWRSRPIQSIFAHKSRLRRKPPSWRAPEDLHKVKAMSASRLIPLAAALVLLAACETTGGPPPPPRAEAPSAAVFRPADFSWSAVPGRGRIDGRLTYKRGAQRFTCAGAAVILTPETPWTRRRMTTLYLSSSFAALPVGEVRARTPSEPGEDYSAFVRRANCDGGDAFSFSGLPDGAWYVITVAKPVGPGDSIAIMRRVETKGGRAVTMAL